MNRAPRSEFLAGVRAEAPILLGVAPFGMIYGALAIAAGLPHNAAQAMSTIVFAGSAQFIATQLIATGTPPVVILLTTLVVNLRHMLYSASVAPYLQRLSLRHKALLAYLLTDEAYVVAITRFQDRDADAGKHWYLLGAGLALWGTWQLSTAAGIFLGSQVPPTWSLDFTLPLTFIALLIPTVSDRPALAAAFAAGAVAVIGAGWPYKTGLLAAALTGIAVGMWAEARSRSVVHVRRDAMATEKCPTGLEALAGLLGGGRNRLKPLIRSRETFSRAVVHTGRDAATDENSGGGSHAAEASGMGARPAISQDTVGQVGGVT